MRPGPPIKHLLLMVLCSALGTLTVRAWVSQPVLFSSSVAGLVALLELVPFSRPERGVVVSAAPLFGFAAMLTLLSGTQVRWSFSWQKRWLRFGYPLAMLACALGLGNIHLPLLPTLGVGMTAIGLLLGMIVRSGPCRTEQSRQAAASQAWELSCQR